MYFGDGGVAAWIHFNKRRAALVSSMEQVCVGFTCGKSGTCFIYCVQMPLVDNA